MARTQVRRIQKSTNEKYVSFLLLLLLLLLTCPHVDYPAFLAPNT